MVRNAPGTVKPAWNAVKIGLFCRFAWPSDRTYADLSLIRTQESVTHHGSLLHKPPAESFQTFLKFQTLSHSHSRFTKDIRSLTQESSRQHTDTPIHIFEVRYWPGSSKVLAQANANSIADEPLSSRCHMR